MTENGRKTMTNAASPALEAAALNAGYGDHVVVAGADLKVAPGEVLTLIGPNGAGKSTIIKTIAGQIAALGGRISFLGKDIKEMPGKERARHCAVALTGRLNPEKMTGREVVETGRYPYTGYLGLCSERDTQKADEAIRLFDAQEIAKRPFEELSDGQKQRLMLARAVCQDTEILVLDEPTSYLDLRYKLEVLQKIRFLASEKMKCVILSLHELDLVRQVSDLVACVKDGKVDRVGTPDEIFSDGYLSQLFCLPQGALDEKTGLIRFQSTSAPGDRDSGKQTPGDRKKVGAQKEGRREICLIGVGSGNPDDLTQRAKDAILSADRIAGAGRMLETAKELGCGDVPMLDSWRPEEIVSFFDRDTAWECGCVLLSGDVGFYSGAKKTGQALCEAGYAVKRIPGLSCLQLLAAACGFSWDDMPVVSLHGEKGDVTRAVRTHRTVFVLPGSGRDLLEVQAKLQAAGLSGVRLHLGVRLGYRDELILSCGLGELSEEIPSPCCCIVENPAAGPEPRGEIADDDFIRGKVPMTKSEVRDVCIAKLHLKEDDVLFDIGAGTGSVGIQAAREYPDCTVYAVEEKEEAQELILANADKFQCANLHLVRGKAPEALKKLPAPACAFIGGTGGQLEVILKALLEKNPRVRIVMTFVTLENLAEALRLTAKLPVTTPEIVQLSAAKAKAAGRLHLMMGQNPVTIVSFEGRNEGSFERRGTGYHKKRTEDAALRLYDGELRGGSGEGGCADAFNRGDLPSGYDRYAGRKTSAASR